jgi:SnoaL-like domain
VELRHSGGRRPAPMRPPCAAGQTPGRAHDPPAFRQPYSGLAGVRCYLGENLPVEETFECWFGEPIVSDDRAAVEWWGSCREQGKNSPSPGMTVLRFDDQGKLTDHRDYDNHVERREAPYAGWRTSACTPAAIVRMRLPQVKSAIATVVAGCRAVAQPGCIGVPELTCALRWWPQRNDVLATVLAGALVQRRSPLSQSRTRSAPTASLWRCPPGQARL